MSSVLVLNSAFHLEPSQPYPASPHCAMPLPAAASRADLGTSTRKQQSSASPMLWGPMLWGACF